MTNATKKEPVTQGEFGEAKELLSRRRVLYGNLGASAEVEVLDTIFDILTRLWTENQELKRSTSHE